MKMVYFFWGILLLFSCHCDRRSHVIHSPYSLTGWEIDEKGNLIRKDTYTVYNEYGDKVKYIWYAEAVGEHCTEYEYEYKDNRKVKFICKDCDGTFNRSEIYTYDTLGRLIIETGFRDSQQSKISYIDSFEYIGNTNKIKISKTFYSPSDILNSYTFYLYEGERIKQKIEYLSDSLLYSVQTFDYDIRGNKTLDSIYYNPQAFDGYDNPVYYRYSKDNILVSDSTRLYNTDLFGGYERHKYIYNRIK